MQEALRRGAVFEIAPDLEHYDAVRLVAAFAPLLQPCIISQEVHVGVREVVQQLRVDPVSSVFLRAEIVRAIGIQEEHLILVGGIEGASKIFCIFGSWNYVLPMKDASCYLEPCRMHAVFAQVLHPLDESLPARLVLRLDFVEIYS